MKDYTEDVKGLLSMYVPPDPQKIDQVYQAGNLSGGIVNLVFRDYAKPGDQMKHAFDPVTRKVASLNIDTNMGQTEDAVTLQVHMASLPDGTSFVQQTVLDVGPKHLVVTTFNSNYSERAVSNSN
jgi:hypothetical protein